MDEREVLKVIQEVTLEVAASSKFIEAQLNLLDSALLLGSYSAIEKARADAIAAFEAHLDKRIQVHSRITKLQREL